MTFCGSTPKISATLATPAGHLSQCASRMTRGLVGADL